MEEHGHYIIHGYALVGYDPNNASATGWFGTINSLVGSNNMAKHSHTVNDHTHSVSSHTHAQSFKRCSDENSIASILPDAQAWAGRSLVNANDYNKDINTYSTNPTISAQAFSVSSAGSGSTQNMQPYIVDYVCQKTSLDSTKAWLEKVQGKPIEDITRSSNEDVLPLTADTDYIQNYGIALEMEDVTPTKLYSNNITFLGSVPRNRLYIPDFSVEDFGLTASYSNETGILTLNGKLTAPGDFALCRPNVYFTLLRGYKIKLTTISGSIKSGGLRLVAGHFDDSTSSVVEHYYTSIDENGITSQTDGGLPVSVSTQDNLFWNLQALYESDFDNFQCKISLAYDTSNTDWTASVPNLKQVTGTYASNLTNNVYANVSNRRDLYGYNIKPINPKNPVLHYRMSGYLKNETTYTASYGIHIYYKDKYDAFKNKWINITSVSAGTTDWVDCSKLSYIDMGDDFNEMIYFRPWMQINREVGTVGDEYAYLVRPWLVEVDDLSSSPSYDTVWVSGKLNDTTGKVETDSNSRVTKRAYAAIPNTLYYLTIMNTMPEFAESTVTICQYTGSGTFIKGETRRFGNKFEILTDEKCELIKASLNSSESVDYTGAFYNGSFYGGMSTWDYTKCSFGLTALKFNNPRQLNISRTVNVYHYDNSASQELNYFISTGSDDLILAGSGSYINAANKTYYMPLKYVEITSSNISNLTLTNSTSDGYVVALYKDDNCLADNLSTLHSSHFNSVDTDTLWNTKACTCMIAPDGSGGILLRLPFKSISLAALQQMFVDFKLQILYRRATPLSGNIVDSEAVSELDMLRGITVSSGDSIYATSITPWYGISPRTADLFIRYNAEIFGPADEFNF